MDWLVGLYMTATAYELTERTAMRTGEGKYTVRQAWQMFDKVGSLSKGNERGINMNCIRFSWNSYKLSNCLYWGGEYYNISFGGNRNKE